MLSLYEEFESLKAELTTIEDWGNDTRDDIRFAIFRFSRLRTLTGATA